MANIKDLPKSTLISIIKNIKKELSKGKILTKLDINKTEDGFSLECFWDDANCVEKEQ